VSNLFVFYFIQACLIPNSPNPALFVCIFAFFSWTRVCVVTYLHVWIAQQIPKHLEPKRRLPERGGRSGGHGDQLPADHTPLMNANAAASSPLTTLVLRLALFSTNAKPLTDGRTDGDRRRGRQL